LVENDSGDVDKLARDITEKTSETVRAGLSGLTGLPAESVGDSKTFNDDCASVLAWVFKNILGMDDDLFEPGSIRLGWEDLDGRPAEVKPPEIRADDPKKIEDWTHSITVTSKAGGQYIVFFKVWTEVNTMLIKKDI
jgi:hypothetical protein